MLQYISVKGRIYKLYMLIQDISKLLYDEIVDKKFNKYDQLVEMVFYLLDYVEKDSTKNYYKAVIFEIVNRVVEMDKVSIEDKIELREKILELSDSFKFEYESMDELIRCLFIPKVEKCIVVDNTLYNSSYEIFNDFRKIVVKRSEVPKRHREKVYSYMYYVSNVILTEVDKSNIEITEDVKDLIWILRMILKTEEFINAYNGINNDTLIDKNKGFGLYYKFTYSR